MGDNSQSTIWIVLGVAAAAFVVWVIKSVFWDTHRSRRVDVSPQRFERQFIMIGVVAGVIVLVTIVVLSLMLARRIG